MRQHVMEHNECLKFKERYWKFYNVTNVDYYYYYYYHQTTRLRSNYPSSEDQGNSENVTANKKSPIEPVWWDN